MSPRETTLIPGLPVAELTFHIFLSKIQSTVKMRIANPGANRQLGWAPAGGVTLAEVTTFLQFSCDLRNYQSS